MTRLWREPLVHFFALGAALFALFEWAGGSRTPGRIVIDAAEIARLAEGFTRTWQRSPTREELEGLVRDQIDEEILYREALALGLDRDDTIVRRRLRQKMEFLIDAEQPFAEPSDAELERHRLTHRERFEEPQRVSFRQVYVSVERGGGGARTEAERLLARLRASDAGWERAGDPISLPPAVEALDEAELGRLFGPEFAAAVFALPAGVWSGPLASGYGLHLVRVGERRAAQLPPLAALRDVVREDLLASRRRDANARRLAELRARYAVRVEWPGGGE